ncbi:MAG: hypothetical protein AMXMBFR84_19180 [Candidatus Hydrogenedentota bacterium]
MATLLVFAVHAQESAVELARPAIAVLEESCFPCHRGEKRKSGLDLSSRALLLEGGDRGSAIDEASPSASLLLAMISYKDEHHQMPPAGKLPHEAIAALTAWITAGAPWPDSISFGSEIKRAQEEKPDGATHWAYQPMANPLPPVVSDAAWNANPIDAFVRAQMDRAGLDPAPSADSRALIRRVTYDLTGLPPSPAEVEAFAADPSEAAYEVLVDKLLASPHYGEKWARHWLDVVRYADSNGYERDANKLFMWRYRDYVIEAFNSDKPYDQFIIEQLAGDELDSVTPATLIATGFQRLHVWDDEPADPEQAPYDNLDDVVSTTAQTFLGMTVGCARCHDHKIDPIPQIDYYRFMAFFENLKPIQREQIATPVMTADEQAAYDARAQAKEDKLDLLREALFAQETAICEALAKDHPELRGRVSSLRELTYRFYRDTWDALPDFTAIKPETEGVLNHNFVTLSPASRPDAIGLVFEGKLHVAATGSHVFHVTGKDGVRLSIDGHTVIETDGVGVHESNGTVYLQEGISTFRLEYFNKSGKPVLDVRWSGPGLDWRPLSMETGNGGSDEFAELLTKYELAAHAELRDRYNGIKREYELVKAEDLGGTFATTAMEKGREVPKTHVHLRGSAHSLGDEVQPGFPTILNPPAPELRPAPEGVQSTGRRRALAAWIASPENALTARVMVNRVWQGHFGKGIVGTPNDFGLQGDQPTHPELLDWLARQFIADEWSVKRLHKRILMSLTYRQSARGSAEALAADPQNALLARFPMRRLTAEEIRDSMLAAAGDIRLEVGGPGFYPDLPEAVLATASNAAAVWGQSPKEEQTRRSIYIQVKRSLLEPLLQDFDLADTDNSCPVRFATTQPLQALNMMNSQYVNERAHALAERLRAASSDRAEQVRQGWALVTQRPATEKEVEQSLLLMHELQEKYAITDEQALDRFSLVALNLNEFMYLD